MTFLAPAWFALLLLAGPIVLLHMRRKKRVIVSSLLLWEGVAATPRPSHALRPPPLTAALVLQLVALVLATAALTRPALGVAGADHLVVLLDAGATQDQARFAASLEQVRRLVVATGASERAVWSLVLVTGRPTPLAVRWPASRTSLADLGPGLVSGGGTADWREAALLARRIVTGEGLTLTSAGAGASGEVANEMAVGVGPGVGSGVGSGAVRVVLVGPTVAGAAEALAVLPDAEVLPVPGGPSAALASASLTPGAAPGQWRVAGEVVGRADGSGAVDAGAVDVGAADAGGAAAATALELAWSAGQGALGRVGTVAVALEPGTAGELRGAFDLLLDLPTDLGLGPEATVGTLQLSVGASVAAFVAHARPVAVRVLYLGPGNAALSRALRALAYVELEELPVTAGLPRDAAEFDLVVLDRVVVPAVPRTSTWWLASARTESEPAPERVSGPAPGDVIAGPWVEEPFVAATDWRATSFGAVWGSQALPGATVLVAGSHGPLLQLRRGESGLELRTAFDLSASDWPEADGFPLFVRGLLELVEPNAGRLVERPCLVGSACALPAGTLAVTDPRGHGVPLGTTLYGSERLASADFVPAMAGSYRLMDARGAARPLAVAALADRLPALAGADGSAAPGRAPPSQVPLRRILVAALFVVLVAEAVVWWRSSARAGDREGLAARRLARLGALAPRLLVLALVALAMTDARLPLPTRGGLLVVTGPRQALEPSAELALEPPAEPTRSDLEQDLDMASAAAPPGMPARLLIAGDGLETRGDLTRAAARIEARGLTLDARVDVGRDGPAGAADGATDGAAGASAAPDAVLRRVVAPAAVMLGDRFELQAVVHVSSAAAAGVTTYRGGEALDEREVVLGAGDNLVAVEVVALEPGDERYAVVVALPGDGEGRNDVGVANVSVARAPRVLLVGEDDAWLRVFAAALEAQGVEVVSSAPGELPASPGALAAFSAAALMNVPAIALTSGQQLALEAAVFDLGLPLLMLGGESAFGPGGYYETPLERLSPTSSLVPREAPELAIAFVLDRSNSMRQYAGDAVRLDIAKVATLSAHELLPEGARSTLIAFDSTARTLVPLGPAAAGEAFRAAVLELDPRGGTNLYPALAAAYEQLSGAGAAAAHVIVMSDGLSQPGDFPGILALLREANVTVSTIAIGPEADAEQLREVARLGGGTFHSSADFSALPGIMAHEVLLQSGELTDERDSTPTWQGQRPRFLRAWPDALPAVGGYVPTSVKPEARLHLSITDEQGEVQPLLASWHYGAGEVVAFTAHAAGPWTREWLSDPAYPTLWAHLVRQLARTPSAAAVRLVRDGDLLRVVSAAADAVVELPGGRSADLSARPAAGGYASELLLDETGTYRVTAGGATLTLEVPYLAVLDAGRAAPERLVAAATATGGHALADLADALAPVGWYWPRSPVWPLALGAALLALLLELTWRYAPDLLRVAKPRAPVAPRKD
ncbi:MAG: VWA domain-containing protein [Trueperaceae bacterium]|nr:VWA domain-containing protein [Trueperaceae bacterium]